MYFSHVKNFNWILKRVKLKIAMVQSCQSCNIVSILFIRPKNIFVCFLVFFSKCKSNIILPVALSVALMGEHWRTLLLSLTHTETTKYQTNTFLKKCLEYNMHLKWFTWTILCPERFTFSDRSKHLKKRLIFEFR